MLRVTVQELIDNLGLKVITAPENKAMETYIVEKEINRPGIQLAGYFDYFIPERIQIIGKTEYTFFKNFSVDHIEKTLYKFFSYEMPIVIITRGMEFEKGFYDIAKKNGIIVCVTDVVTTRFINKLSSYLEDKMAPRETVHGVLVDINGVGVLIKGESSIGKSETALELVKSGHRLVADDAVEVTKVDDDYIRGTAPEILRHYLEIRGIGIIDVKRLYGARAIKLEQKIDLVAYLENWDKNKFYDRLGLDHDYEDLLGEKIEKLVVPVKPGRNIAMILEVAAMNYRQRVMGEDTALEFSDKLTKAISQHEKKGNSDKNKQ